MKYHDLKQNTPEWLAHRLQYLNASDAPVVMGCSPYKSRLELMHEQYTGITPEVDAATQRRFDEGHRFEALSRPLAEKIIGQDLYPVVGSDGKFSASFDGLTMDESVAWEHKMLNKELAKILGEGGAGVDLPLHYRVQMEQQAMVSGCHRVLFMASSWDDDGNLKEIHHCWYEPDFELRRQLVLAREQFAVDYENYCPPVVAAPVVAAPQMRLPAVSIKIDGALSLNTNLPDFGAALTEYVAGINKKPEFDQDFADLEATVKTLKNAEDVLAAAKNSALEQNADMAEVLRLLDFYNDMARTNRLFVDKLVKAEKENRRNAIVSDAAAELVKHINDLNARLGEDFMPKIDSDFQGVIKGLKSIDSMRDKVYTELARCKIEANVIADRIEINMEKLIDLGDGCDFPDTATLVLKEPPDLVAIIAQRVSEQAKKEEALRERIRSEELAKSIERSNFETHQKTEKAIDSGHNQTDLLSSLNEASNGLNAAPATPPSLKLGEIGNRLGFTLTEGFLNQLGFPAAAIDRASKLYHESDFFNICNALKLHIDAVRIRYE